MSPHTFEDLLKLDETVKNEAQGAVQRTAEWPATSILIGATFNKVVKHLPTMNSLWKLHVSDPGQPPRLWFGQVPVSPGVLEIGAELIFAPDKRNGVVECTWLPFASQKDKREPVVLREWLVPSDISEQDIIDVTHEFLKLALAGSLRLPIRW